MDLAATTWRRRYLVLHAENCPADVMLARVCGALGIRLTVDSLAADRLGAHNLSINVPEPTEPDGVLSLIALYLASDPNLRVGYFFYGAKNNPALLVWVAG